MGHAAAQLPQQQFGLRLHPHHRAIGQLDGDKSIRPHLQRGTLFKLATLGDGRRGVARAGLGGDRAVHELHRGRLGGLQAHRNPHHRTRHQAPGVGHLVAGLQQRPLPGRGQIGLGQTFERVAFLHGVGNFIAWRRGGGWGSRLGAGARHATEETQGECRAGAQGPAGAAGVRCHVKSPSCRSVQAAGDGMP